MNQSEMFVDPSSAPMPPVVARDEKARMRDRPIDLCGKVPESVRSGSVQTVRDWKAARLKALKAVGNSRASAADLSSEVSTMERFK